MLNPLFESRFKDRLFPVDLKVENHKKIASFPNDWTNRDFDKFDTKNSIALKTGKNLLIIDVDTKDLTLISDNIKKTIEDKNTFIVETTHGYHLYYEVEGKYSNNVRVAPYVDIRADGGCVFCASSVSGLSYTIFSDDKVVPLPECFEALISTKKVTAYKYSNDGLKVATEPCREANKALFEAVDSGNIKRVIKATGMCPDRDFLAGQMYTDFNRFAFILASEPSIANDDVELILKKLVEDVLGFDWDSAKTQKALRQSLGNMIWSPKYFEPVDDEVATNMNDFISKFSLSDKELNSLGTDEVSVIENILFRGQICILVARPNAGKTLLAKTWAKSIAKDGYTLLYIYEDADAKGYRDMAITGKEHGFNVLASFANIGTTANDILKNLGKLAESSEDLSKTVIVLDTLKKFTEVLDKKANKELFNTLRKVTIKGGSVLCLAHANKYLSVEGNLIFEGTGDIMADVDSLYYMYDDGQKHADEERFATLEREKGRALSGTKELSYKFNLKTYTAEKLEKTVDTRKMLQQNLTYYSNKDKVEFVCELINDGITVQKDIIGYLQEAYPLGRDKAHMFLTSLVGHSWITEKNKNFNRTVNYALLNNITEVFEDIDEL